MAVPAALPPSTPSTRELAPRESALRELAERVRPVVLARRALLPVPEALDSLVPDGGLVRGSIVSVGGVGATSLTLQLVAAASRAGSWVVVVGVDELAPAAVLDAGLDGDRVAFIDPGGSGRQADVLAALIGAVDVIVFDARVHLRTSEARRLASRLRERGSVLLALSPGIGSDTPLPSDLSFTVGAARWAGLERGHGHLRSRHVRVEVDGRGRASRTSRVDLLLPASDAPVAIEDRDDGTVVAFSR